MQSLAQPTTETRPTLNPRRQSLSKHSERHRSQAIKTLQALIVAILFGVLAACGGAGGEWHFHQR